MNVFASIVPPREILDELWSVAEVTPVAAESAEREARPPGWRKLRRRHPETATVGIAPATRVLDLAPVAHAQLVLARFGNLARDDASRLVEALSLAGAEWPSPRLRLSGYSTLESEEDPSIWVDLTGDLDALQSTVRGVPEVAKQLRLFVDRRGFHPRVRLGRVRHNATERDVEALLATLAAFETSAWWQTGFQLLTPIDLGPNEPPYRSHAEIPLGPHVAH